MLLTIAETAERLRVSARTVEREIAATRPPIAPPASIWPAGGLLPIRAKLPGVPGLGTNVPKRLDLDHPPPERH